MFVSNIIESIDTHTAGNPTRNLIAGVPTLLGKTMVDDRPIRGRGVEGDKDGVVHAFLALL